MGHRRGRRRRYGGRKDSPSSSSSSVCPVAFGIARLSSQGINHISQSRKRFVNVLRFFQCGSLGFRLRETFAASQIDEVEFGLDLSSKSKRRRRRRRGRRRRSGRRTRDTLFPLDLHRHHQMRTRALVIYRMARDRSFLASLTHQQLRFFNVRHDVMGQANHAHRSGPRS